MPKHVWVNWEFDKEAWSKAVSSACEEMGGMDALAELLELTPSAIRHWIAMDYKSGFEYPNMTNFLKTANLIDADPRLFWVLEKTRD